MLRSGLVFSHGVVTHPVVAYFAAAPVATRELGEFFCTALFRSTRTDVEGHLWDFFGIHAAGTVDHHKASRPRQISLQRLEGVNTYRALIETPMVDVGLFGIGKKGVSFSTMRLAAL